MGVVSSKSLIIFFIVLIIFVVGATVAVTKNQPVQSASEKFYADVGEIKVSDVVTRDFPIKNTGNKPVQIQNINSSCGCTSGKIIYKDFTSKEFSMHVQSGYVTEIAPGDTATMRLTYRPATMPVYGAVTREVYVTTNDPDKPRLIFSIKAIVR